YDQYRAGSLANNSNQQANPTDEPFDVWWPKYLKRVNESVFEAKKQLEVPNETIVSIPTEPNYVAPVRTYAVSEPILHDRIAANPPRLNYFGLALVCDDQSANFRAFVTAFNMSGSTGKLRLAEGLGLVTEHRLRFIQAVARVRNRYAHNFR